jgi:hypothetical protein
VSDLVLALTLLGVLLAVAALVILLFILRRYLLTRDLGSFDCSLRRETDREAGGGWMLGVARFEDDRLDWFRLFAAGLRPNRSFARTRLLIVNRRPPVGAEGYTLTPGSVIVQCSYGALLVEFAMSELAVNSFATWLESAPPGQHSLVT